MSDCALLTVHLVIYSTDIYIYCGFINVSGWPSIYVDLLMKMTVLRINKFVDNDPINTTSDKQLHFNEHIILCFNF